MLFQIKYIAPKVLPLLALFHIMLFASSPVESFNISQGQAPENRSNPPVLEPRNTIEREIKGGEDHSYQVHLLAGQFLNAAVEQNGIEMGLVLYGPANNRLIDIRGWQRYVGAMPLHWIAEETGSYTI